MQRRYRSLREPRSGVFQSIQDLQNLIHSQSPESPKNNDFHPLEVTQWAVTPSSLLYLHPMEALNKSLPPKPVGSYPLARKVGPLLFLSGVGPRLAGSDVHDSGVPGLELDHNGNFKSFDFEAQVHSVFANVKAILEQHGSTWEQLVDITVFLVDMNRDFSTFNRIYALSKP